MLCYGVKHFPKHGLHIPVVTPMYVGSEVDHPQNTAKSDIFGPKLTYILQLLVFLGVILGFKLMQWVVESFFIVH